MIKPVTDTLCDIFLQSVFVKVIGIKLRRQHHLHPVRGVRMLFNVVVKTAVVVSVEGHTWVTFLETCVGRVTTGKKSVVICWDKVIILKTEHFR